MPTALTDKKSVYIETSIVSYLTARPSGDLLVAAWQKATADWWETRRSRFDLFTSELVLKESARGSAQAAKRRLEALSGIPRLLISAEVHSLSEALVQKGAVPEKALDDALHIAIAAVHGIEYLLTWNCRHIDNAETKPLIRSICAICGYQCPKSARRRSSWG